ncbi:MAG: hypothetical protein GF341_01920 [candidate division Zixibacteria bacterium]|nr:hypothetical protein [candidate division Zixibacteria bacterium]
MNLRAAKGMTLIEIVIIIAILGIISSVAIPKYQDMALNAQISACKAALGSLRSGIHIYHANTALDEDQPAWPSLDTLATAGLVMEQAIPPNPFQHDNAAPDSIVEGVTKGVTVGERGGWAYKPATGQIWPNTHTVIGATGCGGGEDIGENEW